MLNLIKRILDRVSGWWRDYVGVCATVFALAGIIAMVWGSLKDAFAPAFTKGTSFSSVLLLVVAVAAAVVAARAAHGAGHKKGFADGKQEERGVFQAERKALHDSVGPLADPMQKLREAFRPETE